MRGRTHGGCRAPSSLLQAGWKLANKLDAAKCVRSWLENGDCCFRPFSNGGGGSRSKVRFVRQNIIYVPPGGREYTEINSKRRVISLQGNLIFFVCAEPAANCFHISIHKHERLIYGGVVETKMEMCVPRMNDNERTAQYGSN